MTYLKKYRLYVVLILLLSYCCGRVQAREGELNWLLGSYFDQGAVLSSRKDIEQKAVSFSGLMLAGPGARSLESFSIEILDDKLSLKYFDNNGLTYEEIIEVNETAEGVSFFKTFSGPTESGKVQLVSRYRLNRSNDETLVVEVDFTFFKRNFFGRQSEMRDHGIYRFERIRK